MRGSVSADMAVDVPVVQVIDKVWTTLWSCSDRFQHFPETVGGAFDSVIDDFEAGVGGFWRILRHFSDSSSRSEPRFQGDDFLGGLEHSQLWVHEGSGVPGSLGVVLPGDPVHACTTDDPMTLPWAHC